MTRDIVYVNNTPSFGESSLFQTNRSLVNSLSTLSFNTLCWTVYVHHPDFIHKMVKFSSVYTICPKTRDFPKRRKQNRLSGPCCHVVRKETKVLITGAVNDGWKWKYLGGEGQSHVGCPENHVVPHQKPAEKQGCSSDSHIKLWHFLVIIKRIPVKKNSLIQPPKRIFDLCYTISIS